MSELVFRGSYSATSGAQYLGVLHVMPVVVLPLASVKSRDRPKSANRTMPRSTRMLPGLMSLCRTFCSCKNSSAVARQPKKVRSSGRLDAVKISNSQQTPQCDGVSGALKVGFQQQAALSLPCYGS
ncbi:unnamed protein product [Periconia digitata]|uniref:Uncharacterized protein n=1 Tax=Periconia digitata TaxID=1303443 RepID=A0A9W4UDH5_9PLEO|nr:unnamed protein product [Periconia digitata]